jgi:hypothetical protein
MRKTLRRWLKSVWRVVGVFHKAMPPALMGGQWTGTGFVDAYKRNRLYTKSTNAQALFPPPGATASIQNPQTPRRCSRRLAQPFIRKIDKRTRTISGDCSSPDGAFFHWTASHHPLPSPGWVEPFFGKNGLTFPVLVSDPSHPPPCSPGGGAPAPKAPPPFTKRRPGRRRPQQQMGPGPGEN